MSRTHTIAAVTTGAVVAVALTVAALALPATSTGGETPGRPSGGIPPGALDLTVTAVQDPAAGADDRSPARPGFRHVAVHVEAVNHADRAVHVSGLLHLRLRPAGGATFRPVTDGTGPPLELALDTGDRARGVVTFQLPESVRGPAHLQAPDLGAARAPLDLA